MDPWMDPWKLLKFSMVSHRPFYPTNSSCHHFKMFLPIWIMRESTGIDHLAKLLFFFSQKSKSQRTQGRKQWFEKQEPQSVENALNFLRCREHSLRWFNFFSLSCSHVPTHTLSLTRTARPTPMHSVLCSPFSSLSQHQHCTHPHTRVSRFLHRRIAILICTLLSRLHSRTHTHTHLYLTALAVSHTQPHNHTHTFHSPSFLTMFLPRQAGTGRRRTTSNGFNF